MDAILNVSPLQIMALWEDLLTAEYGHNGYGGDVAEIYVSRFMMHSSTVTLDRLRGGELSEGARDDYREACRTLHALCRLFEKRRKVAIEMLEGPLDDLAGDRVFDHRVHLRVRRMTKCCYLSEGNDIFLRERNGYGNGNGYRHCPRTDFSNAQAAADMISLKSGMDADRVAAVCRIAYGETTPEEEGLAWEDIYRSLGELGRE